MITEIIDLLQTAKPGQGEHIDIALGKNELPRTWGKALKKIKRWLKR